MDSDEHTSNRSENPYVEEQVHSWHKPSQRDVRNAMKAVSAGAFRKSAESE